MNEGLRRLGFPADEGADGPIARLVIRHSFDGFVILSTEQGAALRAELGRDIINSGDAIRQDHLFMVTDDPVDPDEDMDFIDCRRITDADD